MYVKKVNDISTKHYVGGSADVVGSNTQGVGLYYTHTHLLKYNCFSSVKYVCKYNKLCKLITEKGNAPETLSNSFFKYLLLFFNNHVYWEVEKKSTQ